MSFNSSPSSMRLQIGFFGMTNAGKSSLVNAFTNQEVSLVSDIKGTTTDPVRKSMELLPIGPVVIIDTPGYDDSGRLGDMRVRKTKEILSKVDIAVLVVDISKGLTDGDNELISLFNYEKTPYIIAYNKSDIEDVNYALKDNEIAVSALDGVNIHELKEKVASISKKTENEKFILDDLVNAGDTVVLVTPIDESAPKGRLILPQQMVLRNALDNNCTVLVCKETELESTLNKLNANPTLVITDSQVFSYVEKVIPKDVKLTSFSILLARYKGDLKELVQGASKLKKLKDGDKVLIAEGCTHHRQCNDIGTVKMPLWIKNFTGKNIEFDFSSGGDFPSNIADYNLVVHCGGCMISDKDMQSRIKFCSVTEIPIINYGVAIALMHGILERSIEVFPDVLKLLEGNHNES